jgi:hypothetical protein
MSKWMVVAGIFLSAARAYAQDDMVGIRLREWYATLEGRIEAQGGSIPTTSISLDRTLGLDDQEVVHEVQAYLRIPLLGRFYAGWWFSTFEGDETLSRTITFADQTFTASTPVESKLDLDVYYLSYEFVLPTIPDGDLLKAEIGVLVGLRGMVADGEVSAAGQEASEDGAIGFPVLGVHGALRVTDWLRADAEIMGLPFEYGSSSVTYVEAFGEVVAQLGPVFAGVGYKFVSIDLADHRGDTDFDLNIGISGVYVTAGLRF